MRLYTEPFYAIIPWFFFCWSGISTSHYIFSLIFSEIWHYICCQYMHTMGSLLGWSNLNQCGHAWVIVYITDQTLIQCLSQVTYNWSNSMSESGNMHNCMIKTLIQCVSRARGCYKQWLPWSPNKTNQFLHCNHVSLLVATFWLGWYLGEGLIQFWLLQGGMVEGVGQSDATFWQCREDCHVHTGISSGLGCNYHLHNWRVSSPIINVHYLQRGTASFPDHFLFHLQPGNEVSIIWCGYRHICCEPIVNLTGL